MSKKPKGNAIGKVQLHYLSLPPVLILLLTGDDNKMVVQDFISDGLKSEGVIRLVVIGNGYAIQTPGYSNIYNLPHDLWSGLLIAADLIRMRMQVQFKLPIIHIRWEASYFCSLS